jgi:hypothetical protein
MESHPGSTISESEHIPFLGAGISKITSRRSSTITGNRFRYCRAMYRQS